jgi:hypothetical protein
VLDIEDLGSEQAKKGEAKASQQHGKPAEPCGVGNCRAVYFGTEARIDLFAAVSIMSEPLMMYKSMLTDQERIIQ